MILYRYAMYSLLPVLDLTGNNRRKENRHEECNAIICIAHVYMGQVIKSKGGWDGLDMYHT